MTAPLIKIVLVALSVLLGKWGGKRADEADVESEPEPERSTAEEWSRTLDLFFSLAICAAIAWGVGLLRLKPLESRGYDAISELIVGLMLFGVKGVFFVILPAFLLYRLLRSFHGLGVRLVMYGIFTVIGAAGWHLEKQRVAAQATAAAQKAAAEQEAARRVHEEVQSMEQARAIAARKEQEQHERAVARAVELTIQNHARWTEDLQAAGAIGFEGELPPMLAIRDQGSDVLQVTNLSPHKACVKLVRVLRQPGTQDYLRCPLDTERECVDIKRGQSVNFGLYRHAGNDACQRGRIEYQVGSPFKPEPSWWSMSALLAATPRADDFRQRYSRLSTIDLVNEQAKLEKLLADTGRAARWKQELGR